MLTWYLWFFLKRSGVFPFCCFPVSLHWSLRKAFLSLLLFFGTLHSDGYIIPFLFCLLFLFFPQLFVRPPQTTILFFYISFSRPSLHSSSGTLSMRTNPLNLFLTSTVYLIYVIPEWSSGFPYFLQFKSEFDNTEFIIWATVSSRSCFCWLYRASPSLAANNIINLISVLTIWWCPCIESSLVFLEEGVCYDQCILLAKLC